ncbi:hypothetical protein GGI21_006246, partial [Coemansia aciculifera]
MQQSAGVSTREVSVSNSFEAANRIQVVVPAAHLSMVYPDSPMSKTDTLRRTSIESVARNHLNRSGHAYLVDPDQELAEEDETELVDDERHYSSSRQAAENNSGGGDGGLSHLGFRGANLHPAASNSTTLHSASYAHQQNKAYGGHPQQQQQWGGVNPRNSSLRGAVESPLHHPWHGSNQQPFQPYHMRVHTPSALGAVPTAPTSSNSSGGGDQQQRRMYAMHRLAGSDTRIDGGGGAIGDSSVFVLPSISNGSPLLSGFDFGGGGGERSPPPSSNLAHYATMMHGSGLQHRSGGGGRRQSTRRSIVGDGEFEDYVD